MRLLRSHGMTTLTWDRHRGHAHSYDVVIAGLQLPPRRDPRGARARAAPPSARGERRARARSPRATARRSTEPPGSRCRSPSPRLSAPLRTTWRLCCFRRGPIASPCGTRLEERRIQTSVHYPPIHTFSAYEELGARRPLLRTDAVAGRVLTLPLYAALTEEQVDTVVQELVKAVEAGETATAA